MYVFFVYFISEILIFLLFAPAVLHFVIKKNWQMVIKIFLAFTITAVVHRLSKLIWYEPRPFVINPLLLSYATSIKAGASSFFSGHASNAFALAGIVFWRFRKFGIILLAGAALIALGRVLAGLHYPHDVIVGAAIGLLISYVVEKLYPPFTKKIRKFKTFFLTFST